MKQYINIIKEIDKELSVKYGRLNLFALFEREDLKDKWDVLISVEIPIEGKNELLKSVINKFKSKLNQSVLMQISRFIYLEPNHEFVLNINMFVNVQNSNVEIKNSLINNINIVHAIVISSHREVN